MFSLSVSPISVGSNVFFALALCAISALVLLLLRRFLTIRATPAYLLVPIFLALALPASVVLLVPIDLASSTRNGTGPKAIWLPERMVLVCWRIAYWLIFMLTWCVSCRDSYLVGRPLRWLSLLTLAGWSPGRSFHFSVTMSTPDTASPKLVFFILSGQMLDTS